MTHCAHAHFLSPNKAWIDVWSAAMRTLIKGGTIATAVDTYEADLAIVDGKIAEEPVVLE